MSSPGTREILAAPPPSGPSIKPPPPHIEADTGVDNAMAALISKNYEKAPNGINKRELDSLHPLGTGVEHRHIPVRSAHLRQELMVNGRIHSAFG